MCLSVNLMVQTMVYTRFAKYAWFLVVYNMLVILWGAVVRATGSGAGCGNHWPQCNGQIIPHPEQIETLIEFVHRMSSGLDGILVLILLVWALRLKPVQAFVRRMAIMAFIFIMIEGMLGAALVRFELVADNTSAARAVMIGLHLVNTLVLLAFLTLTAWSASRAAGELRFLASSQLATAFVLAMLLFAMVSSLGAVTALGDTLFPPETLTQGIQQDFSPTAHFLERLRVWHPVIALLTSAYLFALGWVVQRDAESEVLATRINWLFMVIAAQIGAGFINVALLAPVWMQLVHLVLADSLWVLLVLVTAETVTTEEQKRKADETAVTVGD